MYLVKLFQEVHRNFIDLLLLITYLGKVVLETLVLFKNIDFHKTFPQQKTFNGYLFKTIQYMFFFLQILVFYSMYVLLN